MQTGAVATRISNAAHANNRLLHSGSIVVEDPRLRGWTLTASGGAWAAPVTSYSVVSTLAGDYIAKGTVGNTLYDAAVLYDTSIYYDGTNITSGGPWDLGNYNLLGANAPVTLPDLSTHTCRVSSVALSANLDLVCFYASKLRNLNADYTEAGIYVMRVFDDGAGHRYWGNPQAVYQSLQTDIDNNTSQQFITLPRLLQVGSEYWIVALEASKYAGVQTYHLCYFRSSDGYRWSDRTRNGYLAGVSTDSAQQNVGINSYLNGVTPTAFAVNDLVDAYPVVSGNNLYLLSNGGLGNFVCNATSLVGVTNANQQLDITPDVTQWSLSLPGAPGSAQGRTELLNRNKLYNNSAILRRGSLITRQAGYNTANGNETLTLCKEIVDEVRQPTEPGKNTLQVISRDAIKTLEEWKADVPWEYFSNKTDYVEQFCDLAALSKLNGQFTTNTSGELVGGFVDTNSDVRDNIAFLNEAATFDGCCEMQFKITLALSGQWAGIVLCGQDNKNFWLARYNGSAQRFQLCKATPNAKGHKKYNYTVAAQSGTVALTLNTWYWLRVAQWHQHIMVWSSTDRINWTQRIDYSASSVVIPTSEAYWGISLRSTRTPSGGIGNANYAGGMYQMDTGGSPLTFALRVTSPGAGSVLRRLSILAAQDGMPDDLTIGLATGSASQPNDLNNDDNVLFSTSVSAEFFNAHDSPSWKGVSVPGTVNLTASTYYWIFCTFNSALGAGQSWWFGSQDPGTHPYGVDLTKQSSDGTTWSSLSNTSLTLAALMFCDKDNGYAKAKGLYFTSGELPWTLESTAKDIAAKAGVITASVDDQPGSALLGDCTVEGDVTLGASESGFTLRGATGYRVTLDATNQKVKFYINAVLATTVDSLAYLPQGVAVHVVVVNRNFFLTVHVNECFAGMMWDNTVTATGVVGTYGTATFANVRVPDLTQVQDYNIIEEDESALQALSKLTQKTRAKFYIDYLGRLRISTFTGRTSVDTYNKTLFSGDKVDSDRYWVSHLRPQGNRYADVWDANLLDSDGLRFQRLDFTDAYTDAAAQADAAIPIRTAREMTSQNQLKAAANPAMEREDRITVANNEDGTNADFLVNDINLEAQGGESAKFDMTIGLRSFIS